MNKLAKLIAYNLFLEILIAIPEMQKLTDKQKKYIENQLYIAYLRGNK